MNSSVQDTFPDDNKRSWSAHDEYTMHFYRAVAYKGQFTPVKGEYSSDSIIKWLQNQGVDVTMTSKINGAMVCWDEKFDRHAPNNFCIETHTNTTVNPWIDGWAKTSQAHWLLYCFDHLPAVLDCYALNFPKLKKWFWPVHAHYREWIMPNTPNYTASRLVPVRDVLKNVPARHYLITNKGEIAEIPLCSHPSKYLKDGYILRSDEVKMLHAKPDEKIVTLFPDRSDAWIENGKEML